MDSHSQEYIVHIYIFTYTFIVHIHEIKLKFRSLYIFVRTIRTPKLRPQWPTSLSKRWAFCLSHKAPQWVQLSQHYRGFFVSVGNGVPPSLEKCGKRGFAFWYYCILFFWLVSKITWWEGLQNHGCLIPPKPWFPMTMHSTTLRRRSLLGWYKQESFIGLTEFFTCIKGAQDITIYT